MRRIDEIDDAAGRNQHPDENTRRGTFTPKHDADKQRSDWNRCAEDRRVDDGRERETFNVEELIEYNAEQAVEREARIIAAPCNARACGQATKDEEGKRCACDAEGDESCARHSAQSDLADDGPRAEKDLHGDERQMRLEALARLTQTLAVFARPRACACARAFVRASRVGAGLGCVLARLAFRGCACCCAMRVRFCAGLTARLIL